MQKFRCFIHFKLSGYSNIVIPVWILKISSYVPVLHSVHTILWVKKSMCKKLIQETSLKSNPELFLIIKMVVLRCSLIGKFLRGCINFT